MEKLSNIVILIQNKNQGRKRETIIKQTRTREERVKLLSNKQEPGKKKGNYY